MKMVTWPTGRELMRYTGIVVATIIVVAVFLGLVDWAATQAFNWFLQV
ncbi:preprotein translocase subunit SecE [Aerococcus urinaehominis]|nr:preprotein translocase subunit SecE [Aerococcus urinaehominis]